MPHYQPPTKHRKFARDMRYDSTKAEEMLWQQLKNRQIENHKFRRQVPLKGFILDLVCLEAKLVIEVDGSQHAESESDLRRDALLKQEGFRVLRFWNEEIETALDFVIRRIASELKNTGE
jgi:very-short-patch-repair endonuclease